MPGSWDGVYPGKQSPEPAGRPAAAPGQLDALREHEAAEFWVFLQGPGFRAFPG